jgi:hypothetical protein
MAPLKLSNLNFVTPFACAGATKRAPNTSRSATREELVDSSAEGARYFPRRHHVKKKEKAISVHIDTLSNLIC